MQKNLQGVIKMKYQRLMNILIMIAFGINIAFGIIYINIPAMLGWLLALLNFYMYISEVQYFRNYRRMVNKTINDMLKKLKND